MSAPNSPIPNSFSAAADVQRSLVLETTVEPPSHQLQSSKALDITYASDPEINSQQAMFVPDGIFQDSDAVFADKSKVSVPETAANEQDEEAQVKCSEQCAFEIQVVDEIALVEPSLLGNDGDGTQRHNKRQGTQEKKEKKPRRRGGKARKNKNILNFYSLENKEKKGQQYSREEMELLRFEGLEEQKKKWVEVYCGLSPLVQLEYDGLVELDEACEEDTVPSFDFDPRPQFQKSADLGEGGLQFVDNHLEDLITSDVEGECNEDDDSDEDYSSIQRPAFLVTGEPDFDSGPPQDGLEYLRRVRWEADRVPKVTVGKVNKIKEQTVYMPQIPDIMKCPENLLPLKQWEDSFLADFSELRQALAQLDPQGSSSIFSIKQHESVDDEDILSQMLEIDTFEKYFILKSTDDSCPAEAPCVLETNDDAKVNAYSPENSSFRPILSKILKMDSAARTSMLKRRIRSIEDMSPLPHNDSLWLFALCAAVDWPLDGDTSAALLSLLRKCANLRAAKKEVDDEVVILNILVTISGRYFGQLES